MSTTDAKPAPVPDESAAVAAEQLAERLFADAMATMETMSVHLGVRLGLYRALADGPADPRQLAERAAIHPRYAREWLEQQAVTGILEADGGDSDPYGRVFRLPDGHREVLLNETSAYYVATFPGFVAGFGGLLTQLEEAYRSGGGVSYADYGELTRRGIAGMNLPVWEEMAGWMEALPDIKDRLVAGGARVLDIGCGAGGSSVAIARLFPKAEVHGVDLDDASVAEARELAQRQGLADRVTFDLADAAELSGGHQYDLVCIFEALHDMADPVATLRAARDVLAPGGAVLVGDERVAEAFGAPGDDVERLNYAFSVLHCLPATRAEGTEFEAGTVLRPGTLREYATQAGLTFTVLPIENDLWRFYRLNAA